MNACPAIVNGGTRDSLSIPSLGFFVCEMSTSVTSKVGRAGECKVCINSAPVSAC